MLARTPSAPLAAQKPLQGPTIAPGSPPRHEVAPRALTDRPRATLLTSDPQEQTALVSFVRVHWVASLALLGAMLAGFYMPLAECTLGSVTHVTWELHLAAWVLAFLGGNLAMGWSCSSAANDTMRAISEACSGQTGSSNSWHVDIDGVYDPPSYDQKQPIDYFWEVSHVEHADGRITGSIWKMLPDCRAKRVGALRIAANGRLEVAPRSLRAVVAHYHGRNF